MIKLDRFSTTQPPKPIQSRLSELAVQPGVLGLARDGIVKKRDDDKIAKSKAKPIKYPPASPHWDETYSVEAADELARKLTAESDAWNGSSDLDPRVHFDGQTWTTKVTAQQYKAQVKNLNTDGASIDDQRIQHDEPQLLFAFALGLHELEPTHATRILTALVIDVVVMATATVTFDLKARVGIPRAISQRWGADRPTNLKPLLPVPLHSAYPSGHSVAAHALAHVLEEVTGKKGSVNKTLEQMARDIGTNRVDAGLHVPLDYTDGANLGKTMGGWFVTAATDTANFPLWGPLYKATEQLWY